MMRRLTAFLRKLAAPLAGLALILALLIPVAVADDASDKAALDTLFADLKLAPNAETAEQISQQIWRYWTTPSDPLLAKQMSAALAARQIGDLPEAIAILNKMVVDYPNYAEGWNQRATLYFMLDNLEASLADIDKVLALEPRHFGALSGRVMIYLKQGKRPQALKDMVAALAIHPFLNERLLFPELQQDITRI